MSHPSRYRRWTVKEHNTLVDHYQTSTVSMIALLIDRPEANIKRYLYRIGLRKCGRKPVRRPKPSKTSRKKANRQFHSNPPTII